MDLLESLLAALYHSVLPAVAWQPKRLGPDQARPGRTMPLRQPDSRFDDIIQSSLDLTAAAARLRHQLLEVSSLCCCCCLQACNIALRHI
eukprot:jgi/Chlat1/778/Chrsp104S01306